MSKCATSEKLNTDFNRRLCEQSFFSQSMGAVEHTGRNSHKKKNLYIFQRAFKIQTINCDNCSISCSPVSFQHVLFIAFRSKKTFNLISADVHIDIRECYFYFFINIIVSRKHSPLPLKGSHLSLRETETSRVDMYYITVLPKLGAVSILLGGS